MKTYLILALLSAVVTTLAVPMVRRIAILTDAVAAVRARDIHSKPTPRLGGLAMCLGVVASLAVASQTDFLGPLFAGPGSPWGVLLAAVFVSLLGAADDWWDLSWPIKLAGQVLAAGLLAWEGVQLITLPIEGITIVSSRMSLIVTIVVVVATMNAINFVDGLDGLAAGMVAIGGAAFFAYSYLLSRQSAADTYATLAALILAVTVGACVGFLPYNFNPAKIFMGDSGSMLLGLLFAAATISVTGQVDPAVSALSERQALGAALPMALPFAVLALPLLDMLLAVFRRVRAGESPFRADRMHLHHRLLRLGHTQRRAVLIMYLWTAILAFGTAGLAVFHFGQVVAGVLVGILIALLLTIPPWRRKRANGRAASSVDLPDVSLPDAADLPVVPVTASSADLPDVSLPEASGLLSATRPMPTSPPTYSPSYQELRSSDESK